MPQWNLQGRGARSWTRSWIFPNDPRNMSIENEPRENCAIAKTQQRVRDKKMLSSERWTLGMEKAKTIAGHDGVKRIFKSKLIVL